MESSFVSTEAKDKDSDREASCYKPAELHELSQSAKQEVRGWQIFKLKTTSEIFLIQHTHQRIASHPRVGLGGLC